MKNKKISLQMFFFLIAVACLIPSSICFATELARVNGSVITLEEFNKRYKETLKLFQTKAPAKQAVLDEMIKRRLGIQEAKRLKLDQDPEVLERMETVLYHALLDKALAKQFSAINVTDAEAKAYYTKYPEIRTSQIFVAVKSDATPEEEKSSFERIKKIQEDALRDGKMGFAEAAQQFSEGVAAPMGGDLDYQPKDRLDPIYYETALKLRTPGKVSDIIRSPAGFHIIKLTGIRSWEDVDKAQVKRMVFDDKRSQIYEQYMSQLKKGNGDKVSIKTELLR